MKKFRFKLIIGALFITTSAISQPFMEFNDSIQVKISGTTILNPWAGGLNFIQSSNIDLDLDGIKDVITFDRTGNKIRTFVNQGAVGTVDLKYIPQYESKFPPMVDWTLLVDYNCDGKEDIFTSTSGGFKVFKNTSSTGTGLQFTLVTNLQYSIYNPPSGSLINLYVSGADIPAITDIDDDGDMDVVTFAIGANYLEYHKNMSMELYGTCDSLKFQAGNYCWGYVAENGFTNDYNLFDTCSPNVPSPELRPMDEEQRSVERHAGSCELCLDLDGDADKEFVVGDISFDNLTMLTNGGSLTDASFNAIDVAFPSNTTSTAAVDLTVFPCAFYVDVNNDSKKDLIVSPNAPNVSENFNSVVYYKNNGTNSTPVFQYQQSNFLQDNMIDVGEGAYPVFFDYDAD
ncbi:MAG: VCBS repeat-containing protein, partial [Bacteroidetes bacterium]|nr:VCBS repeat-containing protein [Bacteroidota bacterium]